MYLYFSNCWAAMDSTGQDNILTFLVDQPSKSFHCAMTSRYKKRLLNEHNLDVPSNMCKVAEQLGNRASNLKVASLIPGRAK